MAHMFQAKVKLSSGVWSECYIGSDSLSTVIARTMYLPLRKGDIAYIFQHGEDTAAIAMLADNTSQGLPIFSHVTYYAPKFEACHN